MDVEYDNIRCCFSFNFRQTVRDLVDIIEPGRNAVMKKDKLKRRIYDVQGPNHMWHIDGNDKIKLFGICISGGIDGWSHLVVWLEADTTNKDPNVICNFYLDAVNEHGVVPRTLRVDPGTENVIVLDVHQLMHEELNLHNNPYPPCLIGSTHNQRIERFWGYLRQSYTQFYMDLFKDLVMAGIHNTSNHYHVQCLVFCFLPVIKRELQQMKEHWNTHRMRFVKSGRTPCGIPQFNYRCPEAHGRQNLGCQIPRNIHSVCRRIYPAGCDRPCSDLEFAEWAYRAMLQNGWGLPIDPDSALQLYGNLYSLLWFE